MTALLSRFFGPPIAAPETAWLRALRLLILGASATLGLLVAFFGAARALFGVGAAGAVAASLALLVVIVPVYIWLKTRADDAHLAALWRESDR